MYASLYSRAPRLRAFLVGHELGHTASIGHELGHTVSLSP